MKWIAIISTIISVFSLIVWILFLLNELDILDLTDYAGVSGTDSTTAVNNHISNAEIREILAMSDAEVWQGLTGGLLSARPNEETPANADAISAAVEAQLETITVPTWGWEDEADETNLNKVTKNRSFSVNSFLADIWIAFFTDLYHTDENFVIADNFYGCYRNDVDGIGYKSAHTYGAGIDLNWYEAGNPDGNNVHIYTKEEVEAMPESHLKYQIIYQDSPIVQIAHKYTMVWGGEFGGSYKDIMHFSFVCDGKTREERIQLYGN